MQASVFYISSHEWNKVHLGNLVYLKRPYLGTRGFDVLGGLKENDVELGYEEATQSHGGAYVQTHAHTDDLDLQKKHSQRFVL